MALTSRFLSALVAALLVMGCIAAQAEGSAAYDINNPQLLQPEHLYAESALLVDEDSGEVLFSKNSRVRMFPASTTKIMTLLLALESDIALDTQVTIPSEASDIPEGSSVIPVKPGDVTSFSDLLYGFMLSSGNDGANAVAVLVGGSIENFVDRMNQRAAAIGCEGTHYVNAHGYQDPDHYTTAQDLALISRVAMQNPVFRQIVAAPRWTMTIRRGGSTVNTEIISRNSLLQSGEKYYYADCTGIKTGHHNKAGWCFVGSAEREGKRVICVVLNCEEEMSKWYDAARLFEYGFTRYEPVTLASLLARSDGLFSGIAVEDADGNDPEGGNLRLELSDMEYGDQQIQVVSDSDLAMSTALQRVSGGIRVEWERAFTAPVSKGERMGRVTLGLDGFIPVTASLIASRSVDKKQEETPAPEVTAIDRPLATEAAVFTPDGNGSTPAGRAPLIFALLSILLVTACVTAIAVNRSYRRRRAEKRRHGKKRARPNDRGGASGRVDRPVTGRRRSR